ncbi:MAG: YdeI/OmpD-associated family protein [Actinomycetota bacterium]|nr:YdeI/OmpD-associated family protein [Actinomycetota bacterium]
MVRSDVRKELGKEPGDKVHLEIRLDPTERVVVLEDDITTAFNDASVMDDIRAMSYSHQREYHQWIIGAKKVETRGRRIAKAVAMIGDNQRMR